MKKWFTKFLDRFLDWFYRNEEVAQQELYSHIPLVKTYVIALNYKHFDYWRHINGYSANDRSVRYVTDISVLHGIDGRFAKFVFYGPWRERSDAIEIMRQVEVLEWYS